VVGRGYRLKLKKRTASEERQILIGMIVDPIVLGRIAFKYQKQMFRSRFGNLIATWCVQYFHKYQKAPMKQIESLFESWSDKTQDKDLVRSTSTFLESLNGQYKKMERQSNSDFIIDMAGSYCNEVQVERLVESVQAHLDMGQSSEATQLVSDFNRIEMGVGQGIDILQDEEAIKAAFADTADSIVQYPGELGNFFKHTFSRDSFVAFMGPEGRGKSFWLMDVCYRAMLQRQKVAFFEVGDQSQNQIMRRLMIRAARHPRYPKDIDYPTKMRQVQKVEDGVMVSGIDVDTKIKNYTKKLNVKKAMKACQKVMKEKIRSEESYFRLSCHPNSTLKVEGIENIVQDWIRGGWIPDVIAIDYADILNMDYQGLEGRDRINESWKRLRRLSQTYHCLVLTATQADAESYDRTTMSMRNFSEDKRKFAHVTAMLGLNQTGAEKKKSLMRLNYLKLRDDEFLQSKCIHVAGCLALGNPCVLSKFLKT